MKRNLILVALLAMLPACDMLGDRPSVVNHSFAKPDQVAVEHMVLDLEIDFDAERIRGSVTLEIVNKSGAERLYLDTRGLVIEKVTLDGAGNLAEYTLGDEVESIGQPLAIDILPETKSVTVYYETTEGATALDWLRPEQTAGGKMPFLYTQGQSILNRTWIPCQDSPEVRITYDARIKVPKGMLAVMSASNSTRRSDDGVYEFSMPQPIPTYLIALAAGDLEFRPISDRCGVYAEPYIVDRAAWEFADTESMIRTAEALYGPYRWDRYDVIVLPPSFPYGGMENPRLSFVTPVLVAGDRSLVSTIAHELAHSWSGNLVTNATWDDFWLNEGFTVYFERRIMEAVYGRDDAELDAVLGVNELKEKIESLGEDHPDTRLALDVSDRNDPDDGLSTVAYNKGYLFLRLLEESVGRERMDAFLRKYFDTFAFGSMTSERFVEYLRAELIRGDE
ncbi:MAG: M1 family aminopeptidase/hydrolase, partial [bacterium]|nr:M1 family aminopeptidase/hydrolase [bacterium]